MAKQQDETTFCKWMHFEKGQVFIRRIHVLEVQVADGRVFPVTGDQLPDSILTFSQPKKEGKSTAHVLIDPKNATKTETKLVDWDAKHPITGRDLIAVAFGFLLAGFLNAMLVGLADLFGI